MEPQEKEGKKNKNNGRQSGDLLFLLIKVKAGAMVCLHTVRYRENL